MILIVAHHYALHGFKGVPLTYSFNRYIVGALLLGGKLGVDIFVMITGYFMCTSKFTASKFVRLVAQTWFYTLIIGCLFLFVLEPTQPVQFRNLCFPLFFREYWFMTDFMILMLLSPALNIMIQNLRSDYYRNLLIGVTILWTLVPWMVKVNYSFSTVGWFTALYLFAGYIRKNVDVQRQNAGKHLLVAVGSYALVIGLNFLYIYKYYLRSRMGLPPKITFLWQLNSPFMLLTAISLLIGFIKLKPFYSKWINIVASATLGVYLIHDNNLLRPYLWTKLLKCPDWYASPRLLLHAIASILGVYVLCSLIDLTRKKAITPLMTRYEQPCCSRIFHAVRCFVAVTRVRIKQALRLFYR